MAEIQRSGKYKGKTRDLTKKQVAAGRRVGKAGKRTIGKKEAKRAMKAIDIRETSWKKAETRTGPRARGGIVVDRAGKPITGTVTLASGKTATYVRGKRVRAVPKKGGGGSGAGGGGGTSNARNIPTSRVSPSARGEGAGGRTSGMTAAQANRMGAEGPKRSMPGRMATKATMNPGATRWGNQVTTQRVPARNYTSQPKNPNIGDTWTQKYPNGRTIKRRYTAGGWRVTK